MSFDPKTTQQQHLDDDDDHQLAAKPFDALTSIIATSQTESSIDGRCRSISLSYDLNQHRLNFNRDPIISLALLPSSPHPIATMAPTNPSHHRPRSNPRPAFSPPRPGKGKEKGATKKSSSSSLSAKAGNGVTKQSKTKTSANGSGRIGGQNRKEPSARNSTGNAKLGKSTGKNLNGRGGRSTTGKGRSRAAAGTMRGILDEEDEGEDDDDDDDDASGNNDLSPIDDNDSDDADSSQLDPSPAQPPTSSSPSPSSSSRASSPEPDYILAEITHGDDDGGTKSKSKSKSKTNPQNGTSDSTPPIPRALIHLMLTHHFQHPESTSLSVDARSLLSKYVEVFVREGIRRCAAEKKSDRLGSAVGAGGGGGGGGDAGWLEVEDLEKIGVQLCLDF